MAITYLRRPRKSIGEAQATVSRLQTLEIELGADSRVHETDTLTETLFS